MLLPVASVEAIESSERSLATVAAPGGGGRWEFNRAEKCLMRRINRARSRHGLRRLERDKQIGVVARRHAKSMAASYAVFHDYNMDSEITHWSSLGQNSGAGGGCTNLFRAFMRSSRHRANILGRWRFFAVGVDRRYGRIFAQGVFEWRYNPGNVYH